MFPLILLFLSRKARGDLLIDSASTPKLLLVNPNCRLCSSDRTKEFFDIKQRIYWICTSCDYIFLDEKFLLEASDEKARYKTHENHIENQGYIDFLMPCVLEVQNFAAKRRLKILDYGCGPGPVLGELLKQKNHDVSLYDPFFTNNQVKDFKEHSFDAITCTEAFEHFYSPKNELEQMRRLLKPGGKVFIKTEVFKATSKQAFEEWYYKNDPTHVGFLSQKTVGFLEPIQVVGEKAL